MGSIWINHFRDGGGGEGGVIDLRLSSGPNSDRI